MFTPSFDRPRPAVLWRAAWVLLLTLLAHAVLLQRVNRELSFAGLAPEDTATIVARLLPPPAMEMPPASAPKPRPRQAPARPKPPPIVESPPPAAAPEPAPVSDAPPVAVAETPPPVPAVEAPPPAAKGEAAPPPEPELPIAAGGEMLYLALADLPVLREALPMRVRYLYRTTNSELKLATASTVVDWQLGADGRYLLRLTTTALGITVMELLSEGSLQPFGLAPERYVESRTRRGAETAQFDWELRRLTFTGRSRERPLIAGAQDRVSFQIQLMLLGQAQPEWFRPGRQFVMWMAGRDDLLTYRFRSVGPERTLTGIGPLEAVRIERLVTPGEARIEVWLVPQLGWLPVRLRFTDRLGRITESVLESIPAT